MRLPRLYPVRGDERWPQRCGCGYAFVPTDEWQRWTEGRTAVPAKDESIIGRGIASRAAPCGDEIRGRIVHQRRILRAANRYCCKQGISLKPTRINWGWIGPRSFQVECPGMGIVPKLQRTATVLLRG